MDAGSLHGPQMKKQTSLRAMVVYFFFELMENLRKIFTVFCCKSEECRNFALLLIFFCHFMTVYGTIWCFLALNGNFWHVWPVTLFCGTFTFVAVHALFRVIFFWHKPCSCNFFAFFHVWAMGK